MAQGFNSPKLDLHIGDGIQFLQEHRNKFDVIITDSADPIGKDISWKLMLSNSDMNKLPILLFTDQVQGKFSSERNTTSCWIMHWRRVVSSALRVCLDYWKHDFKHIEPITGLKWFICRRMHVAPPGGPVHERAHGWYKKHLPSCRLLQYLHPILPLWADEFTALQ